jgi:DNA topoisomerase-2
VRGKIKRTNDTTLVISELPIGKWTQDYKAFLEKMMDADKSESEISDFKEHHTETTVKFILTATKEKIDEFEKGKDGLLGKFKLSTTISTKNMTLFDENGKIHKYETALDVLQTFFHHRLEFYAKRKDMLLSKLKNELKTLANKERFIKEVCDGDLVVRNRKRTELLAELSEREYDLCPKDEKKDESDEEEGDDDSVEESATDTELAKGYEYLLGMKIWSLTFERAEDIRRQRTEKSNEAEALEATSPESIWLTDLDAIDEALVERNKTLALDMKKATTLKKRAVKQTKAVAKKAAMSTKKTDEWDSDLASSDSEDEASADEDDDSFNNDDFIQKEESPKKKQKTSATKSSRLSSSGKQKVILATRTERKSLDVSRKQSSNKKAVSKKEHPKEIPVKKKTVRRRKKKSSILKEALDAQLELVDSDDEDKIPVKELNIKMKAKPMEVDDLIDSEDESPKKKPAPALKADAFEEDYSVSEESPASSSKKKSQLKPKKKSICHLSSDEESEGYESEMSVDKRTSAPKRGCKRLSKPKRSSFEESDEDDFMF